jgi:hypothetical protein
VTIFVDRFESEPVAEQDHVALRQRNHMLNVTGEGRYDLAPFRIDNIASTARQRAPPMQPQELAGIFTTLTPNGKATVLARIAHEQTIHARAAYINYATDPAGVDATALRRSNELIHRLCGRSAASQALERVPMQLRGI